MHVLSAFGMSAFGIGSTNDAVFSQTGDQAKKRQPSHELHVVSSYAPGYHSTIASKETSTTMAPSGVVKGMARMGEEVMC